MKLVFIHGWGFDRFFWDELACLLPDMPQTRVDMGFFDDVQDDVTDEPQILIGHSMGLLHGLRKKADWRGWVGINSFGAFVASSNHSGCAEASAVRAMKERLARAPEATLKGFYGMIGAAKGVWPILPPKIERLSAGLDELITTDAFEELSSLNQAGLVLACRDDPLVPQRASADLAGVRPGNLLIWNDKNGHLLPLTDAGWCAKHIRSYCGSIT